MGGHLEIKHFRMIHAIAESGSMTQASKKLYISQSALSQQLKDIEEKLQISLFFRTKKKMLLTPAGKKLLTTAKSVLQAVESAELELAKLVAGEHGQLKIGTHCIFCFKWLPEVMRQFQQKFPNIDVEIGTSEEPTADLNKKTFDIVITGRVLSEKEYTSQTLFQDQLVCVMSQDNPLHCQEYIAPQDFKESNLISHTDKGSRIRELVLKPNGIEPKRFMCVGQPHAILELVSAGLGVSIFPRWAIQTDTTNKPLVARPISKSGLPITWSAVSLKSANVPIFQQEFVRIIKRMQITKNKAQQMDLSLVENAAFL